MKPNRSSSWSHHSSSFFVLLAVTLFFLFLPAFVSAQEDDYQEWVKKQQAEFGQYQEQQDKDFLEFLKQEWKLTELEPARPLYTKPKPEATPALTKEPPPPAAKTTGKPVVVPKPVPSETVIPVSPKPPVPPPEEKYTSIIKMDFFGVPIEMRCAPLNARLGSSLSELSISDFWKALSESHNEVIVDQALRWRKEMRLNDWGYCLLIKKTADALFSKMENESVLCAWFLLVKSGYDARVGYSGGSGYLLLPSTTSLFGLPYFSFSGSSHRYYALNLNQQGGRLPASVNTYEGSYPGASRLFDFSLSELPRLGSRPVPKKIRFTFGQEIRAISVTVDQNLVEFLKQYPQTPFDVYFNAPVSAAAAHDLVEALAPFIKGKSEVDAVNILLRFVQTAFKYRTDQENFGREKPLFVDETLFYDASDCEDRAVLFSFLVKKLTGLQVIGLNYPGHMATAVKFSTEAGGDVVKVGAMPYTVCDPTYVFADAGRSMPEFRNKEPRVIAMKTVASSQ